MQNNSLDSTSDCRRKHTLFGQPATYCITVEGHLDDSWCDCLGGMKITKSCKVDQCVISTLEGSVRDQAELSGVLNTLYELHMSLLMVKILPSD